ERDSILVDALAQHRAADRSSGVHGGQYHRVGLGDPGPLGITNPLAQQRKPTIVEPVDVEVRATVFLDGAVLHPHRGEVLVTWFCHRVNATPGGPSLVTDR